MRKLVKEAVIVKKIMAEVKQKCPRAWVRKLSDRFTRGLSDIMIAAPAKRADGEEYLFLLAVECKRLGEKPTELQEVEGVEINALPCARWIVATGMEDVERVLSILQEHGCLAPTKDDAHEGDY